MARQAVRLSIILPTHNRASLLRRCLEALAGQRSRAPFEVIVVDDGSTDDTRAVLATPPPGLRMRTLFLAQGGANRARNAGASLASGDLLLFLGDDMLAAPDLVEHHVATHQRHPEESVGVVGHIAWAQDLDRTPFMDFLAEPDSPFQFCFTGFDADDVPVGHLYGSNHSVKRAFFERCGGFDPDLRIPAYDDVELEYRYRRAGFRLVFAAEARTYHHHPHDVASFVRRMRMAGRAAVRLYRNVPESATLTDLGTLLSLHVDADHLERESRALQSAESRLVTFSWSPEEYAQTYADLRSRWWDLLMRASAMGVWDEIRESGWEGWAELLHARVAPVTEPAPASIFLRFAHPPQEAGLQLVEADGRWEPVLHGGREAGRVLRSPHGGCYLYLRMATAFLAAHPTPLEVQVEYLDQGVLRWGLDYDSMDVRHQIAPEPPGAFKPTRAVVDHENTQTWKVATFHLTDGLFLHRCHGADFRITVAGEGAEALVVSQVTVHPARAAAGDPPPEVQSHPSEEKRWRTLSLVTFPEEPAPQISIIIPVHNLVGYTAACLAAVRRTATSRYEVIVVDNGSIDDTPGYLSRCEGVRCLRLEHNAGFAAACNRGAHLARGKHLLFLNNDTIPLPGWLSALETASAQNAAAGIVGAKLLYPRGAIQHAGVGFSGASPYHVFLGYPPSHPAVCTTRAVPAVTGACLWIRRDEFWSVGGFDERYRNGFEDIDLCLKLAARGRQSLFCAKSVLYHHTSATPGREDHSPANYRLFVETWQEHLPALPYLGG